MNDSKEIQRLRHLLAENKPEQSVPLSLYLDRHGRRIRLCRLGQRDLEGLVAMYMTFNRDQSAMGLPPKREEAVRAWLTQLFLADVQLVAKHGPNVVAHAAWIKDHNTRAEVMVFVHQDFQGDGLGKKMLMAVVTMARFMGLDTLWAEVENRNGPMIHINHELGFETVSLHQGSREMSLKPR